MIPLLILLSSIGNILQSIVILRFLGFVIKDDCFPKFAVFPPGFEHIRQSLCHQFFRRHSIKLQSTFIGVFKKVIVGGISKITWRDDVIGIVAGGGAFREEGIPREGKTGIG